MHLERANVQRLLSRRIRLNRRGLSQLNNVLLTTGDKCLKRYNFIAVDLVDQGKKSVPTFLPGLFYYQEAIRAHAKLSDTSLVKYYLTFNDRFALRHRRSLRMDARTEIEKAK